MKGDRASGRAIARRRLSAETSGPPWVSYERDDTPSDVRLFNAAGKLPQIWLDQSRGFNSAAQTLCAEIPAEGPEPGRVIFHRQIAVMLGGFAIETILKMVLVAQHVEQHGYPGELKPTLDFIPKTHDLAKLADQAGIRISKDDRITLVELRKYVVWSGRYPTPLDAQGYRGPAIFEDAMHDRFQKALWEKYDILYEKLFRLAALKAFHKRIPKRRK
jgi:hypothetical protein